MVFAALSTGGVVAIVVGSVSVIAGAFYALVHVQGERIKDARADFGDRVETLDSHIGERLTESSSRLEQQITALGDRLEASVRETHAELAGKIDAISTRLDRVEDDLRATS